MSRRPRSKCRVVFYGWSKPDGDYLVQNLFDEAAMERVLSKAREQGVISQYDTGRGAMVWFEGAPGESLRALKAVVLSMIPHDVTPIHGRKE